MRMPEGGTQEPAPAEGGEVGPAPALLDYSVEPHTVECSGRNGPERAVSLTVHAFNAGAEPVRCRLISIQMPLGEGQTALTDRPWLIWPAPGRSTPWHVSVAGEGRWECALLPPQVDIPPGRRASFEFSHVVVNTTPDKNGARLTIREHHGSESAPVYLFVKKLPSSSQAAAEPA